MYPVLSSRDLEDGYLAVTRQGGRANSHVADGISLYGLSHECFGTMMFVFCAASGFATGREPSGWGKSMGKLSCSKSRKSLKPSSLSRVESPR